MNASAITPAPGKVFRIDWAFGYLISRHRKAQSVLGGVMGSESFFFIAVFRGAKAVIENGMRKCVGTSAWPTGKVKSLLKKNALVTLIDDNYAYNHSLLLRIEESDDYVQALSLEGCLQQYEENKSYGKEFISYLVDEGVDLSLYHPGIGEYELSDWCEFMEKLDAFYSDKLESFNTKLRIIGDWKVLPGHYFYDLRDRGILKYRARKKIINIKNAIETVVARILR